jgi:hypothetical protein
MFLITFVLTGLITSVIITPSRPPTQQEQQMTTATDHSAPQPRYYGPIKNSTGSRAQQPSTDQLVAGWRLDLGLNFHETEFLDAPDFVPVGAVRALDISPTLTLGCDQKRREVLL